MSLALAREKADEIRKLYRSGIDPVTARRQKDVGLPAVPSFAEAAHRVFAENQTTWRNAKHRAQWIATLEAYAFPTLGPVAVDAIDGPMVRDALLPIWLEKAETARRVRQRIGVVLDWSHANGFRPTEAPMRSISRGLPRQPKQDRHLAAMPYEALPVLMTQLSASDSIGRLALQFTILTAARSGEVRGATWGEIDLKAATWTIPALRMKAGRTHVVPLSRPTLDVLNRAGASVLGCDAEQFVFPGLQGERDRCPT